MSTEPRAEDLRSRIEGLSAERRRLLGELLSARGSGAIPAGRPGSAPLSASQARMWVLAQLIPETGAAGLPTAIRLRGPLNLPVLRQAFDDVVRRHEVLRSVVAVRDGGPVQLPGPRRRVPLRVVDLSALPAERADAAVDELLQLDARRPFDLQRGPLLRVTVAVLGPRDHLVAISLHHIATDDWSMRILARELSGLYRSHLLGQPCPWAPPPIQYRDFARWQRGRHWPQSQAFWAEELRGMPTGELPWGNRDGRTRYRSQTWVATLPPSLTARLRLLQRRAGGSLFMLLLAALMTLIHRLDGRDDVIVGTLAAGRVRPELEELIGYFVNVLMIRGRFDARPTFRELWRRVRDSCIAAFAHQDLPYEQLLERLRTEHGEPGGHRGPVRVLCVAQQPAPSLDLVGLSAQPVHVEPGVAQFDLVMEIREQSDAVRLAFTYDIDVVDETTVRLLGGHLRTLLEGLADDPDARCDELPLPPAGRPVPALPGFAEQPCVPELFEEQTARTPDAIAVGHGGRWLSYQALNARSNQLARHLRALGLEDEDRVGVCLDRSPDSTVALLAVLKAGAAFVPLDPGYPTEALTHMLTDAAARWIVTAAEFMDRIGGGTARPVLLDRDAPAIASQRTDDLRLPLSPDNVAYLSYTSGSTGRPKGVLGLHRGMVNRFGWMWRTHPYVAGERACHRTPLSFVDSVWELFGPLLRGVPVEVIDAEVVRDPRRLVDALARAEATRIVVVPSLLRVLLDTVPDLADRLPALRRWSVSGERLSAELADRFHAALPGRMLLNLYGSAEVAADVTAAVVEPGPDRAVVPIGRPIDNTAGSVLDAAGRPVAELVAGELQVAGAGLARGYWRRPADTAARFVPAPDDAAGGRAFRTGDRCRYRPDGVLEFVGRLDDQVKVRGFRVEPGEVEEVLLRHPAVAQAAVTAWPDAAGGHTLAGYVVLDRPCPPAELRAHARGALPPQLVPSVLAVVQALPYTPSGKVDRRRLPPPAQVGSAAPETPDQQPGTAAEQLVAAVFAELLPVHWRSVHDDFFSLGGHSILAAVAVRRLSERCGVRVELRDLFATPTIAELARAVSGRGADTDPAVVPVVVPQPADWYQPFPLTDVQQAYWIGRDPGFELGNVATHAYFEVDAEGLDPERLSAGVRRLVDRHHSLRTVINADGTQQVQPDVPPYEIAVIDLRPMPPGGQRRRLSELRTEMSHQVLPADRWPLFDIRLSLLGTGRSRLHVSIDALVADAYSVQIMMAELGEFYRSPAARLEPLELSFRDCVLAELAARETAGYQRSLEYWRRRLDDLPPGPELPLVREPGSVSAPRFRRLSARLTGPVWAALAERAADSGLTRSGLLLAAFSEVLTAWSRRPHYTLTLTLFTRPADHPQLHRVIGDFTSLMLLEIDHREPGAFLARARRTQEQLWADLDHRAVSGVTVMREWTTLRGGRPGLLAPVVFTSTLDLAQVEAGWQLGTVGHAITQTPQLYLDHQVAETPDGVELNWDVVADLFPAGVADDMFAAYVGLLRRLAVEPDRWHTPVRDLLPAAQLRRRAAVNATAAPLPRSCLHAPLADTAAAHPDAPAVITPDRTLDYREVSVRAARVARRLRARGVGRGRLVGIAMHQGWEQVIAVHGVSASGAAYVPLDPELPAERMSYLAGHTEIECVLTQSWLLGRLPGLERLDQLAVDADNRWPAGEDGLHQLPGHDAAAGDLAYVLFTSGSTGTPKGVMIDHRGALNTIADINRRFSVGPDDRVLGLSSLSFDLSVYDLFGALATGAALVIPSHAHRRDPAHWIEVVSRERVTVWNSVPALMTLALDRAESLAPAGLAPLRLVLLSGDWIPVSLPGRLQKLAGPVRVVSLGGATEASIWSVCHPVDHVDPRWSSIPYGRPLANQRLHVLDAALEPRPDWVAGDLHIGGDGLALGYWRDPERTGHSFATHPRTGERLYRTGDLARYRDDGELEFLGREDLQVKVSGHRVELGEVETALATLPGIVGCAVAALGPRGEKRLAAYYVAESAAIRPGTLRAQLSAKLPGHLVPTTFIPIDALPLTANGKVDRAALTDAAQPPPPVVAEPAVLTRLEQAIAELWAEVLGVVQVARDANFFQLGGTSLVALRLLGRLQAELQVELPLVDLFESPTVAELAVAIAQRTRADPPQPDQVSPLRPAPAQRYEPFPLTPIQQAYWLGRGGGRQLGNIATHSYSELDVAGLDVARLEQAVQRLVSRHDALRTIVLADGSQRALDVVPAYRIVHRDLRDVPPGAAAAELDAVRRRMSHQVRPVDQWPLFEIRAHRLDDRRTRLHVGVDLLVADAHSFRILQRELAELYHDPNAEQAPIGCTFRDYVLGVESLRDAPAHRRAQRYWRDRLPGLPLPPPLPLARDLDGIARPRFERLQARLDAASWVSLQRRAAEANLTPSGVLCAAFAEVLAMWGQRSRFLLTLTTFNRIPLHPDVEALVGDFTSTTLLAVDASAPTFTQRAGRLQEQIFRDLEHRMVSGIDVLRMLRSESRRRADVLAPVVFTSTLVPEPGSGTPPPAWDAEPVYSVSQTSQVLIDHQVAEHDGELIYTWDHLAEAFPPGMIGAMFEAYRRVLYSLVSAGAYWKADPAWSL